MRSHELILWGLSLLKLDELSGVLVMSHSSNRTIDCLSLSHLVHSDCVSRIGIAAAKVVLSLRVYRIEVNVWRVSEVVRRFPSRFIPVWISNLLCFTILIIFFISHFNLYLLDQILVLIIRFCVVLQEIYFILGASPNLRLSVGWSRDRYLTLSWKLRSFESAYHLLSVHMLREIFHIFVFNSLYSLRCLRWAASYQNSILYLVLNVDVLGSGILLRACWWITMKEGTS